MENKKTCLYDKHVELNALISPFAGFEMPIQYKGIIEEHNAVRNACGMFDVSHMGEVLVTGKDATNFVNYIFTNDVKDSTNGKCFYGMMLNTNGGVVDDLLVYKINNEAYFLVINASNIEKDYNWIKNNTHGFDIIVTNKSDEYGEIAVQGPLSEKIIEEILDLKIGDLEFYSFKEISYHGEKIIVSRTGYTGEDGFEIYSSPALTNEIWQKLLDSKKVEPCGLGCRDTLRFEVGLPLYGDELTDEITPVEAGLSMFVKLDKPDFIGKNVIERQKVEGPSKKLVGLELKDKAIPRHGYEVLNLDDKVIGHVTTGYHGISVDKSIAMALIDAKYAKLDNEVKVKIRKKTFPAIVTKKKFYKKSYKQ